MSRPLFEVGEVVLLQSKNCPDLNGEYQILEIVGPGESTVIDGNKFKSASTGHIYDLGVTGLGGHTFWDESSLRKRHQPGEYSFEGLKQVLGMPVSREDIA